MANRKKPSGSKPRTKKPIEQYEHSDKQRANNPHVGLVKPDNDPEGKKKYTYDPHFDPQLVWAGKAEHTAFEVPTVSLHVHERIDPKTILGAVRKRNGTPAKSDPEQLSLFTSRAENPPLHEALDFYKHPHGWSNRLIAGDSLLVMNSLLEKEGMAGKVQMIYLDPPYGIRYGSNFQPFVNKRDVKDGKDEDLTQEPEMIRAFRDTWELGIHSYLTYLRDRLLLSRELLHDSGSIFVQISDDNVHHVRELIGEIFGENNFSGLISFVKTTSSTTNRLAAVSDYLVWYAKDIRHLKYHQLYLEKKAGSQGASGYGWIQLPSGGRRRMNAEERETADQVPTGARIFTPDNLTSQSPGTKYKVEFDGRSFFPTGYWKTEESSMPRIAAAQRLIAVGNSLRYVRFIDDFSAYPISSTWVDTSIAGFAANKRYVVETAPKVVERCILLTTDPGDLVFDPTCGSGTMARIAEQWGRRWITCDTSRVATSLAKQRLMTALFDYYELGHPAEGVGSGFVYKTVPHVTLKSIANNPEIKEGMTRAQIDAAIAKYADQETLYDLPKIDRGRARVAGPFTARRSPLLS